MAQQRQSIKSKFIKLQNLLASETKSDLTITCLSQLLTFFQEADMSNEKMIKGEVYDELRDSVKSVFTYLQKVKVPNSVLLRTIQKLIKDLLIAICQFCSAYYCTYHPTGCGQMIKDFLSSDCRLFVSEEGSLSKDQSQEQVEEVIQREQINWIWAKQNHFKTHFFCDCIEVIMRNLCKFEEQLPQIRITVIGQFFRLIHYMNDYIIKDKLVPLCLKYVDLLESLFRNPSKQIMKDANKQKVDEISDYLTKLLRYQNTQDLNKKIQLLGPLLGMTMLKMNSIQKKIVGCKILSKFSYQILYRSTTYITETSFSEWIVAQNFFDLVFEDHCQASLIKSSQDTFKLLVKRGKLKKQQFNKFFQLLEKAEPQLRRAMFRLIDPFRVDYYQIETILDIFKTLKGVQFYDDEYFYFLEGLSRYSTEKQLKVMIDIVEMVLKQHYHKFQTFMVKRKSVQCYAYVFDRLITYKDIGQRIEAYLKVAEDFINQPSENKLIMLKSLFQNLSDHKMVKASQESLYDKILIDLKFIERSLKHASKITFRDDLISTIKTILRKYLNSSSRQPFSRSTLLECVDFPQIFQEMLKLVEESQFEQLEKLFNELASLSAVKDFSFTCIKLVFQRLNSKNLRPVNKQYTDVIGTYVTCQNPAQFVGVDTLKYLIFNSSQPRIKEGACELLVQIHTNLANDFRQEGELYLIEFMKKVIHLVEHKLKQFFLNSQPFLSVEGALQLMQNLLLNTEYFGVGSLPAHNSLIPTSTVALKVYNNCTYGDDVQKIYEKKLPSNKTLFDIILDVSKQFKVAPLDISLEYQNNVAIRHNGLTLQQLKLNGLELNVIRLHQSRLKKEPLMVDGKLTPRSRKVFEDIFHKFAPDGSMSSKQCAQYIAGVTLSYCPLLDSRISSLMTEYDTDKDGILTVDNLVKFYEDCLGDPEKVEVVDKNLANLRYRKDLRLFDDPLESLNQQVLFRHHIWNNRSIYEYLFKLSGHQNCKLSSLAQTLILRLPTYPEAMRSLEDSFQLKDKSSFQVEYLLTALKSQVASDNTICQKFIKSNNHLSIFQYLKELISKQDKSVNENNCQIICLHLLHSLLSKGQTHEVNSSLKQFPELSFQLPQTDVFVAIIRQNIKKGDSTLLEPSFYLQLTQNQMSFDWIEDAVFNKDKDIRSIVCGFIYLWILKHPQTLDLFKVPIAPHENQQWFHLLTKFIQAGVDINSEQIFNTKLKQLQGLSESLENIRFNPIIHGNLKIIKELHSKLSKGQKEKLCLTLNRLLPSLLSNQNRQLVYQQIAKDQPIKLLNSLAEMVEIKVEKQSQPRNKFVGIRNLGCICYMNSIVQQFFMIKQFHSLIMSLQSKKEESQVNGVKIVDDFLHQLQQMYLHLEWSQKQYYDPSMFCLAVKDYQGKPININLQEDAHQFLNTAFDKIEQHSREQQKHNVLQHIFGGKTVTQIICQTCKNKNQVLQNYYHLTVEVKGMKNLKQSFDKLILPEEISDYFCVNCDKKVQKITKQTLIKQAPQVLVVNLQRIVFDLETFLKVKVHTKLQFDQTLDLHSYFSSSSKPVPYYLKGVVIHSGTSEGGHYYSLIKHEGKWFKFNDQSVTLFNQNDIGREAFGGEQHFDTMTQYASSTNAYILFYEREAVNEEAQTVQINPLINQKIKEEVLSENKIFEQQYRLYQPSFFASLNSLFNSETEQTEKDVLEVFFGVYLKLIQHMVVNSDIKVQLLQQIKDNMLKLCDWLPEKSLTIVELFPKTTLGQILCTHNDVNIRQIYQKMLGRSISNLIKQSQFQFSFLTEELLDHLLGLMEDDLVTKNVYKSYQYFDLWNELIKNQQVKIKMIKKQCLGKMLNLLMGSDSTQSSKDKKKADLSISEAMPLIPLILALLQHKINLSGQISQKEGQLYFQMTQLEVKILNNPLFYRKMMRSKLDMGLLGPIISRLCWRDERYSKWIIQILIRALNNNDQIEDKAMVFKNIKAYLLVEDYLTVDRLKWGLGIPQLDSISFKEQQFGLTTSSQSKVISYVSSLLFIKDQKYSPLLFVLFDNRNSYKSFEIFGLLMLLQLVNQSQLAREHLLRLPAPTYAHKTYVDWIDSYAEKLKAEEHYGLPLDKPILIDKFSKLLQQYHAKADSSALFAELPVNKSIIGKNYNLFLKQVFEVESCRVEMWVHETYILPNRPYSSGNLQLPDQEFSFTSTVQSAKSKLFVKGNETVKQMDLQTCKVEKQLTVLTFSVKSSLNFTITFKKHPLLHKIYLKSGQQTLNCPYTEGDIKDILDVGMEKEAQGEKEMGFQPEVVAAPEPFPSGYGVSIEGEFGYMQVGCKECTYLNVGRETCEMCGAYLLR